MAKRSLHLRSTTDGGSGLAQGQSKVASLGRRVRRAHRSRQGALALVLAGGATVGNVRSWGGLLDVPGGLLDEPWVFAGFLLVAWAVVGISARMWESATWPKPEKFAARPASASTQPMLRLDANGKVFTDHSGFLFARRYFFTATGLRPTKLATPSYVFLADRQSRQPVCIAQNSVRTWWWYEDKFYWDSHGYSAADVACSAQGSGAPTRAQTSASASRVASRAGAGFASQSHPA